jgi:hypothetical protein
LYLPVQYQRPFPVWQLAHVKSFSISIPAVRVALVLILRLFIEVMGHVSCPFLSHLGA